MYLQVMGIYVRYFFVLKAYDEHAMLCEETI